MDQDVRPCGEHTARIKNLEVRQEKLELILDRVRSRPPVWGSVVFGILTLIIGWLIKGAT